MRNAKPLNLTDCAAAALSLALTVVTAHGRADEQAETSTGGTAPTVLTSQDALKKMSGMAGYYRAAPTGDLFLYPEMKLAAEMYGMYGTYRVTPEGILLRPGGAAGITMAESAMGGASGTFRITPTGQAFFYSHQMQAPGTSEAGGKGPE